MMSIMRVTRFRLPEGKDEAQLHAARRRLLDHVRTNHQGLRSVQLARLEDGRLQDIWLWDSRAHMQAVVKAVPEFPDDVRATLGLAADPEAIEAEVIETDPTCGCLAPDPGC